MNALGEVENHNLNKRLLTDHEENAIVEYINDKLDSGRAVKKSDIIALGNKFFELDDTSHSLGNAWYTGFMKRNPKVQKRFIKSRSASNIQESRYEKAERWFEYFHKVVVEGEISDDNVYNMGEINIHHKGSQNQWYMELHGDTDVNESVSESTTELATVLETINMEGKSLQPYVMLKGLNILDELAKKRNVPKFYYQCFPLETTSETIAIDWLQKIFLPQTKAGENGKKIVLILNDASLKTSDDFFYNCLINKVLPLFIPTRTSYFLQPLDQSCFINLKNIYRDLNGKSMSIKNYNNIEKTDFVFYYDRARKRALNLRNICQSWKIVGLKGQNYQEILDGPMPLTSPTKEEPRVEVKLNNNETFIYESPSTRTRHKALFELFQKSEKNGKIVIELLWESLASTLARKVVLEQICLELKEESSKLGEATESSLDEETVHSVDNEGV